MPKLMVTVPYELYDAVQEATNEAFADSYLSGAIVQDGRLIPRTQMAWARISESPWALKAIRDAGLALIKPKPYRD